MTRRSNSESSRNKFKVFDFDDYDDRSENMHKRFSADLRNQKNSKKRRDSPINKYNFLQSFACGTDIANQGFRDEPIDVDAEGCQCTYSVMYPKNILLGDGAVKVEISGLDAHLASSSSTHKNEPIGVVSSETSDTETSSSTTSTFCLANDEVLEKQLIELDCSGCEIDNENASVKILPDFVLYGDISFVASCLRFSCSGIKLEGSSLNGTKKTFCFEWTVRDIISIESEWTASVETVMVRLHLKPKTSKGAQNENKSSDDDQLAFAVYDPNWARVQEAIKRLDVRYKDIWNTHFDTDKVKVEKDLWAQSITFCPKHYFYGSDEPFEDVIYPRGEPDSVTIHKRDVELLDPERFINDTIIDFYIKYLANSTKTEERHRFHFFNCFFFRKLADLDKDPSSAYEGKEAFQRVRKWTRKVNIFEKDYIFIPVNYSLHWSLLVICHPGEVPNFKDEEPKSESKVPCILHMDSLRGGHKGLKNLIQSYLCEEWKERHNATTEDASSNFLHLKFVPLELPQQENLFDCGLFLLHYMERFLEEAPLNFSPFNITKFSKFLTRNWFPPAEASLKRNFIKKLIYEILQEQSRSTPADSIDRKPSPVPTQTSDEETGVIFLGKSNSTNMNQGISSPSNAEQVGFSLSKPSLTSGFGESGLVSPGLFEPGDCSMSCADVNYLQLDSPCHRRSMTPIEEVEESDEQVAETPLDMEDCELIAETDTLGKLEVSVCLRKLDERISVSSRSQGSQTLSGVGQDVGPLLQEVDESDHLAEPEKQESSSTSCEELAGCVVPDSEEEDSEHESNEVTYIPFISLDNNLNVSSQSTENIFLKGNDLPTSNEDAVSESDVVKAVKRRRLKPG